MPNVYELWKGLPLYIKEALTCHCPQPELVRYDSLFKVTDGIIEPTGHHHSPGGYYCIKCNKPHKTSIARAVEVCDECDKYYVPEFKREEYPIRWRICPECS